MELKDYLRILRRNLLTFFLVSGMVIAGNFYLVGKQPVNYESRAQMILKEPQSPWIVYTASNTPTVYETLTQATRLNLIESEPVMRRAVKALARHFPVPVSAFEDKPDRGGSRIPSADEAALYDAMEQLRRRLNVESSKDTEIVSLTARDRDPELTRDVCNAVAVAFSEFIDEESRRRFQETVRFLEEQEEQRREQISRLQIEHEKYRVITQSMKGPGDVSDLNEDLQSLRRTFEELSTRLDAKRAEAEPLRIALQQGVPYNFDVQEQLPEPVGGMGAQNLQVELEGLLTRYTPRHPRVQSILRKLETEQSAESKRRGLTEERRAAFEAARLERAKKRDYDALVVLELESKSLQGRLDGISKEMEALRARMTAEQRTSGPSEQEVLKAQQQMELLGYQLEIAKRGLSYLLDRRADLDLQRSLQAPSVQIVSPAKLGGAIGKAGTANWIFVSLIGVMIGVASAYFRDYLNTTIRTEHDVRRYLNLPVLGSIVRLRRDEPKLLLDVAPKTPLHEVFNTITALLEAYASENQARLFTVASSRPEEGKSTVTSNLAIALARSGERVVLIDCDLRKAVLHRFFSLDNGAGLAVLAERAQEWAAEHPNDFPIHLVREALLPTAVENLRVLPAGPSLANPVTLLKSDFFHSLLRALRDEADMVLVDVPPANLAVDTMLVAPQVDGVVLLVSAGEANKEEVTYAKRLIESSHGKLVGCVLNKVTLESHGYYYYPYYRERTKQFREG